MAPSGGDTAANLIFGAPIPVLNGDSRANRAGAAASARPAGAAHAHQTRNMCTAELRGERKMKAPSKELHAMYDDYLNASEEYTFNKLHATLGRLERKAEREHSMYQGAAGWSTEHRNDLAERRASPGGRRCRSPARFGSHEQARMRDDACNSVSSLLQQGNYVNGLSRGSTPRQQPAVPPLRRVDEANYTGGGDGMPSSRPPSSRRDVQTGSWARPTSSSSQRAASPRGGRAPSPSPRAASPFRH